MAGIVDMARVITVLIEGDSLLDKFFSFIRKNRRETRYSIHGEFKGSFESSNGDKFHACPIDISKNGLGIIISPSPHVGQIIKFRNSEINVEFKVIHIKQKVLEKSLKMEMRRCGLKQTEEVCNLLEVIPKSEQMVVHE